MMLWPSIIMAETSDGEKLKEQVDLAAGDRCVPSDLVRRSDTDILRAVPEFIYLLLAAEKIGASVLCRTIRLKRI